MMLLFICLITIFFTAAGGDDYNNLGDNTFQQFFGGKGNSNPGLISSVPMVVMVPYQKYQELCLKLKKCEEQQKKIKEFYRQNDIFLELLKKKQKTKITHKKSNKRKREDSSSDDSNDSENQTHRKKKLKPIPDNLHSTLAKTYYKKNTGKKKPRKKKKIEKK